MNLESSSLPKEPRRLRRLIGSPGQRDFPLANFPDQPGLVGIGKWKQRQRRCGRGQACGRERMGHTRVAVGAIWRTVTQGSSRLATLICSLPCHLSSILDSSRVALDLCPLAGCGTMASVASRVPQPAKGHPAAHPAFLNRRKDRLARSAVPVGQFLLFLLTQEMTPASPRKGRRRCARARSTLGWPLASP